MGPSSFSPGSTVQRGIPSDSRSKSGHRKLDSVSQRRVSLHELTAAASRCRTPKQFRKLLSSLETILPYRNLICGWGYPHSASIGFLFNHSFPIEFVRWFLARGLIWKSPVFKEWLRTNKTQIWLDVAKRQRRQFDPELLVRLKTLNLQYSLNGGLLSQDLWVFFAINMASEKSCRAHAKRFETIVPVLAEALKRACPRPLLTERERAILERRAMGELIKQIAAALEISERTVRMHLQRIKKKLYTDDLVNAVVIAVRSGMLAPSWKEWRWRNRQSPERTAVKRSLIGERQVPAQGVLGVSPDS